MCCVFCDELLVVLRVFNASWSIAWSRSYCVSSSTPQAAPSPPSWWALFSGLLSGSASGTYFAVVTNRHGASTGCGQPGTLPGGGSVWVVCSEQVQLGPVWAWHTELKTTDAPLKWSVPSKLNVTWLWNIIYTSSSSCIVSPLILIMHEY